jgi:S-adenosylmethionine hydrolase
MSRIISLLTDFGTADGYVGEMKGVLLSLAPDTLLVDVAHDVQAGDIAAGCYVLGRVWRSFPKGTVHLAVVDPGVGSARRALAAEAGGQYFVAPDNGLLSDVFAAVDPWGGGNQAGGAKAAHGAAAGSSGAAPLRAVSLAVPATASRTFHGRDVFAPAAARLAGGAPLLDLGAPLSDPVRLKPATLTVEGSDLVGEVIHVDRFGTLITNLPKDRVARAATVKVAGRGFQLGATFADVPPGEPVAFAGSGGTVEIAVRDGRADVVLGVSRGGGVRATAR